MKRRVDRAVDDDVGDVDALRPELARHALRQRPQRVLGAGEGGRSRAEPRMLAVAPVKMIVPRPRGSIALATSRPIRKPPSAPISQTLR